MRIILDTNVLISALIQKGKPRELLFKIVRDGHELAVSKEMLEEFAGVSAQPKIRSHVGENEVQRFLRTLEPVLKLVRIRSKVPANSRDPDDNVVLRTCYDGKVRYLVSGDSDLLTLGQFRRTKIVTVAEMLQVLERSG
jgi:putative PIN family toxin of toxin-antitoxin system